MSYFITVLLGCNILQVSVILRNGWTTWQQLWWRWWSWHSSEWVSYLGLCLGWKGQWIGCVTRGSDGGEGWLLYIILMAPQYLNSNHVTYYVIMCKSAFDESQITLLELQSKLVVHCSINLWLLADVQSLHNNFIVIWSIFYSYRFGGPELPSWACWISWVFLWSPKTDAIQWGGVVAEFCRDLKKQTWFSGGGGSSGNFFPVLFYPPHSVMFVGRDTHFLVKYG